MSIAMSIEAASTATVINAWGNEMEIQDDLYQVYDIEQSSFAWYTLDDRVMGGKSYSYSNFESSSTGIFPTGYGKFNGTASSDGGGFSLILNINQEDEDE